MGTEGKQMLKIEFQDGRRMHKGKGFLNGFVSKMSAVRGRER